MQHPQSIAAPAAHAVEAPADDTLGPDIVTATDQYALRFAGEAGAFFLQRQAAAVAVLLDRVGVGPFSILDVGGGHAQLTQLFLARGHSVVVHGSSAACFERMARLEAQYAGRLERLLGPLRHIPADDASFDVVCSIRLLAHVASWRDLLAEKCRLARRFVICEFPVRQGLQRLARALHMVKVRMEPDTRAFATLSLDAVSTVFEQRGFRVIEVQRQFVLPMALHRRLASATLSRRIEHAFAGTGLTRRVGSPVIVLAERITS